MDRKMNQKKIAEALGISQTAVSLVFNNPETTKVSEEKRKKILAYLKKNSYLNHSSEKRTWNIGYVVDATQDIQHRFYHLSIQGIEQRAEQLGYSVFSETYLNGGLNLLQRGRVDGLVVRSGAAFEYLRDMTDRVPMVLLNCAAPQLYCDTVMPDNYGAMFTAVEYLVGLGHRRIAFLGARPDCSPYSCNYAERQRGFMWACAQYHTELESGEYIKKIMREIVPDEGTYNRIGQTLKEWMALKKRPTAVVCVNHFYAVMLMHLALEAGLSVPGDLSVIGGDNKEETIFDTPPLTTLEQDIPTMGEMAMDLLSRRIADPKRLKIRINCRTELVARASTGICHK